MKINKLFEYRKRRARFVSALAITALLLATLANAMAQTTTFTYQGKLTDTGNPANGNYDLTFTLFDSPSGGAQQGNTLTNTAASVTNGMFRATVELPLEGPNSVTIACADAAGNKTSGPTITLTRVTNFQESLTSSGPRIIQLALKMIF